MPVVLRPQLLSGQDEGERFRSPKCSRGPVVSSTVTTLWNNSVTLRGCVAFIKQMQNQSYIPVLFATRWQSDLKSSCSFTCLLRRSRRLCGIKSWGFLDKPKSRTLFMWASDKVFSRKDFGLLASCVAFSQHYHYYFIVQWMRSSQLVHKSVLEGRGELCRSPLFDSSPHPTPTYTVVTWMPCTIRSLLIQLL